MSLQNMNKEINDINKSIFHLYYYTKIIDDILYNFQNIKLLLLK